MIRDGRRIAGRVFFELSLKLLDQQPAIRILLRIGSLGSPKTVYEIHRSA